MIKKTVFTNICGINVKCRDVEEEDAVGKEWKRFKEFFGEKAERIVWDYAKDKNMMDFDGGEMLNLLEWGRKVGGVLRSPGGLESSFPHGAIRIFPNKRQ